MASYESIRIINSSTFSAGGDSGSLIVTANTNQPVALLFAGSSTTTIGNPIGDVLTQLSAALGRTVSFVGSTQASSMTTLANLQDMERATQVKNRHEQRLMSLPDVFGVGVSFLGDNQNDRPEVVIYADRGAGRISALPEYLDGVKVRVVHTDAFVAR